MTAEAFRDPGTVRPFRPPLVLALLLAAVTLSHWWPAPNPPAAPAIWPIRAFWRPDGGQVLSPRGDRPAYGLARLALGYKLDLGSARAYELTALPGLGPGRARRIVRLRRPEILYPGPADFGLTGKVWDDVFPYVRLPDGPR